MVECFWVMPQVFYVETKGELARMMPDSECCIIAELSAIARSSGRLEMRQEGDESRRVFEISTESAAVARKIMSLVRSVFQMKPKVRFTRRRGGLPGHQYIVELPGDTGNLKVLHDIGVVSQRRGCVCIKKGPLGSIDQAMLF